MKNMLLTLIVLPNLLFGDMGYLLQMHCIGMIFDIEDSLEGQEYEHLRYHYLKGKQSAYLEVFEMIQEISDPEE